MYRKDYLKKINSEIWVKKQGFEQRRGTYTYLDEARKLTHEEFYFINMCCSQSHVMLEPCCFNFGFDLKINIHIPGQVYEDVYPGAAPDSLLPELIIAITTSHYDQANLSASGNWDAFWNWANQYTHSEYNKKLLEADGFEQPKGKSYYEY